MFKDFTVGMTPEAMFSFPFLFFCHAGILTFFPFLHFLNDDFIAKKKKKEENEYFSIKNHFRGKYVSYIEPISKF